MRSRVSNTPMKIHEYQAKDILAKYGVAVPRGEVANTLDEALEVARRLFINGAKSGGGKRADHTRRFRGRAGGWRTLSMKHSKSAAASSSTAPKASSSRRRSTPAVAAKVAASRL